jgi:CcmD family protein
MIDYAISIKYMLAGYAVIFIVLAIYTVNLIMKWSKLLKEYRLLRKEEKQ